jgi:hypothetical protein
MNPKKLLLTIAAILAACVLNLAAYAGDPTGTWQWTNKGRGDRVMTATLTLDYKDGQLTGSLSSRNSETAIADASFHDPVVAFSVTREFRDQSITITYSGKLDGDTIKGTMSRPGRDGGAPVAQEWIAKRVAPGAADAAPPDSAP